MVFRSKKTYILIKKENEMENMKCFDCVLKHLSAALSFGKEILSGHSMGNELDHRIDFLG
jgi:hypothetical protein